ncbi:hypothetical protein PAMP_018538 [Pampus punctatissimus]
MTRKLTSSSSLLPPRHTKKKKLPNMDRKPVSSENISMKCSLSPPPPPPPLPLPAPPPPPPPALSPALPPSSAQKKKLYQTIASSRSPVEGDHTEALLLLRHRDNRCGLVALWMAAQLCQPQPSIDMDAVVRTALSRGYTAQGEMFSANNMALLAEEVCSCKAELLSGGLGGKNADTIITHLWGRQPVLIPYPKPSRAAIKD